MLNSIRIANFKSCRDVVLEGIGAIVALVGRNGAGKTNVMRAIEFAASSAVSSKFLEDQSAVSLLEGGGIPRSIEFDFSCETRRYRYRQSVNIVTKAQGSTFATATQSPSWEVTESLDIYSESDWKSLVARNNENVKLENSELQIGSSAPSLGAVRSLLPQDEPLSAAVQEVLEFFSSVHYYSFEESNSPYPLESFGIIQQADYAKWIAEHGRSPSPVSSVQMRLLYMHLRAPELLEELKGLLGADGLGVIRGINIQAIGPPASGKPEKESPDPSSQFYWIRFLPNDDADRGWRQYGELSFGTRRVLRIFASVLVDRSALMLIEQPEDGIHPGLLHKLIPLLATYSDKSQFILSSHSPAVFNRLLPEQIRLVEMDRGTTTVRALDVAEVAAAERFISEDGPLSDFLESVQS